MRKYRDKECIIKIEKDDEVDYCIDSSSAAKAINCSKMLISYALKNNTTAKGWKISQIELVDFIEGAR